VDINEAIFGRRSVREYTAQSVDEETIRRLIDAAVHAPNAVNQQPWTFTVVRDREVLDRLARDAKSHMLATMPAGPHADRFRSLLNDPNLHIFYRAPVLIDFGHRARSVDRRGLRFGGGKPHARCVRCRLGSCWIGFAQSFLNTPEEEGARPSGRLGSGGADHRRVPDRRAGACRAQGAGGPVGRLTAISRFAAARIGVEPAGCNERLCDIRQ
jgi:hypothetical protein